MKPTRIRFGTILGTKENILNIKITWTLIFSFLQSPTCFSPTPSVCSPLMLSADVIYKIANSDNASKSVDIDSHLIDFLMKQSQKLRVPAFFFPKFDVNSMERHSMRYCILHLPADHVYRDIQRIWYCSLHLPAGKPVTKGDILSLVFHFSFEIPHVFSLALLDTIFEPKQKHLGQPALIMNNIGYIVQVLQPANHQTEVQPPR